MSSPRDSGGAKNKPGRGNRRDFAVCHIAGLPSQFVPCYVVRIGVRCVETLFHIRTALLCLQFAHCLDKCCDTSPTTLTASNNGKCVAGIRTWFQLPSIRCVIVPAPAKACLPMRTAPSPCVLSRCWNTVVTAARGTAFFVTSDHANKACRPRSTS